MIRTLGLLFLLFVIAEMAMLITLGRWLGVVPTIVLVLGAGVVGAWLARAQGLKTAMRARTRLAQGAIPTAEMTDGLLIALAAVLLILPGVLSDFLGLALLFPPTRALLRQAFTSRFARRTSAERFTFGTQRPEQPTAPGDQIIDARVIDTRVVDE